jgi:hypothetical protein
MKEEVQHQKLVSGLREEPEVYSRLQPFISVLNSFKIKTYGSHLTDLDIFNKNLILGFFEYKKSNKAFTSKIILIDFL